MHETCPYVAILARQTGLERTDFPGVKGVTVPLFSRTHMRSPVSGRVVLVVMQMHGLSIDVGFKRVVLVR